MILSLIAGVFSLIGSRSHKTNTEEKQSSADQNTEQKNKKASPWGWAAAITVVLIVITINTGNNNGQDSDKKDPLTILAESQPSDLRPEGELADLFALGGTGTDLQRESKFKEIKGSIVEWRLPVYNVKKHKNGYRIQTSSNIKFGPYGKNVLGTFVYITPLNHEDREVIESLKTGDHVKFKEQIKDVSMRNFEINPAILSHK